MDADTDCVLLAVEQTPAVHTAAAFLQGDIIIFRDQKFCIIAERLQFCCHATRDDAIVPVFHELSVRAAFACRELAVAVVNEDFHKAAGCCGSSSIPDVKIRRIRQSYRIPECFFETADVHSPLFHLDTITGEIITDEVSGKLSQKPHKSSKQIKSSKLRLLYTP